MFTGEPRLAGTSQHRDKHGQLETSTVDVQCLIGGLDSDDFTLAVVCKDGRWLVSYTDRESGNPAPCFGSGPNLEEAWRRAGKVAAPG